MWSSRKSCEQADGLLEWTSGVNFLVATQTALLVVRPRGERVIQIAAIGAVVALLAFAVRVWPDLPAIVPTHFDFSGEPDAWGSRARLLVLPTMATLVFLVLTLLERAPHVYNDPTLGRQLVLAVKLIVVVTFAIIFRACVDVALGNATALPGWFLPAVLGSIFGVILVTLLRMNRTRA
jgi:hypothetical protein